MGWIHPRLPILPASPNQGISPSTLANALRILGCQSAHDGGKLQAARLLMVIYASALVASKLPVQLLSPAGISSTPNVHASRPSRTSSSSSLSQACADASPANAVSA